MKRTRKSIFGRVAASLVAAAMLASMTAVPAFAEGEGEESGSTPASTSITVPVTKVVTTDGNTFAPATSFEFTVANGDGGAVPAGGTAYAGVTGGLTGTTITSTPNTGSVTSDSYTFTGALETDPTVFKGPGIYHYTVSETKGTYEGIDYSTESYDVYVYVVNGDTSGTYKVDGVIAYKQGDETKTKTKALTFTNDYGKDRDTTHDVIVKKVITGNMSTSTDTFNFTVGVTGAPGEAYKVVYTNNGTPTTTFVTSGNTITVEGISHNDTIHIYGLTESDTYTVTEVNPAAQGYTATDDDSDSADGTVNGNATADTTDGAPTYTVTNTKEGSAPTGIIMNIAPYALLVVVALGACCIFFVRKRREA